MKSLTLVKEIFPVPAINLLITKHQRAEWIFEIFSKIIQMDRLRLMDLPERLGQKNLVANRLFTAVYR